MKLLDLDLDLDLDSSLFCFNRLKEDIEGIIGCLESLQSVDTEGVSPLISPSWDGTGMAAGGESEIEGVHLRVDEVPDLKPPQITQPHNQAVCSPDRINS